MTYCITGTLETTSLPEYSQMQVAVPCCTNARKLAHADSEIQTIRQFALRCLTFSAIE